VVVAVALDGKTPELWVLAVLVVVVQVVDKQAPCQVQRTRVAVAVVVTRRLLAVQVL
jgi:hypothetical protein